MDIIKYVRTPHLEGSRLQPGDEDLKQVPYSDIAGRYIVVEEKVDGANSGIRFSQQLELLLQSRGHYLQGGGREKHFNLLKSWASTHTDALFDILGTRYLMYGEWAHSKHTVFYDRLPHYFLEFDIWDTERNKFLSTAAREAMLHGSPVVSVPVLYRGIAPRRLKDLVALVKPSLAKSNQWRKVLEMVTRQHKLDLERVLGETDMSDLSEGLYIKIEEGDETVGRLKWVRHDFLQNILDADSHWLSRPIVPNQLAPGVDIFSATPAGWTADLAV